ncbi:MAG TPA: hypothetical protein EYG73_08830 [Arcobacter sp.]|nr:hypothetical protein [Arcobacter sp.]
MKIITIQEELENIISKHQDLIGRESKNLEAEYSIGTAQKTKEAIEKIDGGDRLLQIGILGRVKAGKSSLLNALLFDGKAILPKAATPMTAALTIISYGEKLSAEVEFFKQEDIENIKQEAEEYKSELKKSTKKIRIDLEIKEIKKLEDKRLIKKDFNKIILNVSQQEKIKEKAEKRAKREIKSNMSLVSSFDQWQRIKESNVDYKQLLEFETVNSDSLENLSHSLLEYVGSDGKYMPFTKSVHIKIPQENLKGIQIVDTPGVNDPVQSREERTRELLKFCDVVFIVSPSGQFMTSEDLDLMDRITSKEGIRELYVIASQADLQLFGSIKEESNGDLHQAFTKITDGLAGHLHATFTQLKKTNPEIGTVYDSLIEQSRQKIIHSSGICLTIKEHFTQRELWDEGVKTAWKNLTTHYPDYFSDTDEKLSVSNLDLLANISNINTIVEEVKVKKDSILQTRKDEFIKAKLNSLMKYKQSLLRYIDGQIKYINNGNIEELKNEQKKLHKIKDNVSYIVDDEYALIVKKLEINMDKKLEDEIEHYFQKAKNNIENTEDSKTDTSEHDYGFFSWKFGSSRYETREDTYTIVRTGAIKKILDEFTKKIEKSIKNTADIFIMEWKENLKKDLLKILRKNVDDDDLNIDAIRKVIKNVLTNIEYPKMTYRESLPETLSQNGVLKKHKAEEFISNAQDYIFSLDKKIKYDIDIYLDKLILALKNIEISQSIFGNYNEILKLLEEGIINKKVTLDKLNRIKNEIGKVVQ